MPIRCGITRPPAEPAMLIATTATPSAAGRQQLRGQRPEGALRTAEPEAGDEQRHHREATGTCLPREQQRDCRDDRRQRDVPEAFTAAVRMRRVAVHADGDADPGQRTDDADLQRRKAGERLDHLRQPEDHAVGSGQQAEPQQARHRDQRLAQHGPVVLACASWRGARHSRRASPFLRESASGLRPACSGNRTAPRIRAAVSAPPRRRT